jgi:lipopolysaccharide/colanic/teichoic acid biosynthesis glycosyltransferase
VTKRLIDIVLSAVALVVLSPVLAIVGVCVVVESGRPVFFRQTRVGRGGGTFTMYKFRTMRNGDSSGPQVTAAGDARITRVGAKLRSTKLDELPQLWNVLRGDMSLVGPRPEVQRYVDLWPPHDKQIILSVRPGITDPASHVYRREAELLAGQPDPEGYYRSVVLPDKVRIYVDYVASRDGLADLRILLRTFGAVVAR